LVVGRCLDKNHYPYYGNGNSTIGAFCWLEISDLFETVICLLNMYMWLEVIKVIKLVLEFLRSFDARQAHNTMAIMLDPCFKALHIVENLVGCGNAIQLASEYDVKVVIPLLMVCFGRLNLVVGISAIAAIDVVRLELEKNMFGVGASIEESSQALVTRIFLFRRLSIPSSATRFS
jgi:hypothetical protein